MLLWIWDRAKPRPPAPTPVVVPAAALHARIHHSEREKRLERGLRLCRMALTQKQHGVHDMVAVIDNALRED